MSNKESKSKRIFNPNIFESYRERILKSYLKKYPTLVNIYSDHKVRIFFRACVGFILGIFLYNFIILDLKFENWLSFLLGVAIFTTSIFGCILSKRFRCVCFLMIPGFFGKAGRSVLRSLVLGYITAGPIINLILNSKEVMRSFACTTQLTYNLTRTKYDLMVSPFRQAMVNMNDSAAQIKDTISLTNDMIEPIAKEVEDDQELKKLEEENDRADKKLGDSLRSDEIHEQAKKEMEQAENEAELIEVRYREKIAARCEEQLTRGADKCREAFENVYDKCYNAISWIVAWLLCWPMKLTFVCNLVQVLGGTRICDPEGNVDVGIGEGYSTLKDSRDELKKSLKDAKIKYNLNETVIQSAKDANRVAVMVMQDFETRKTFLDALIALIKRCICLVFLQIIFNAWKYHDLYLTDIQYDNVYITPYFRKIDARRRAGGRSTLLPLKKLESTKFIDPYKFKQSRAETINFFGEIAKLLLEIIIATTFVMLDKILYDILDIIRRHSHMKITQTGQHNISLEVKGVGIVAKLMRTLIRGFNTKRHIKKLMTNEACLPEPKKLSKWSLFQIYGTYIAVFLILVFQAYSQRLRRLILSSYYRKREKRRVLYLYNEILRRRLGFLRFTHARLAELSRARRYRPEPRPFLTLRLKYQRYLFWLRYFDCARQCCVICEEVEDRRGSGYYRCSNEGCFAVYCKECWRDIGEKCLACSERIEQDEDSLEEKDNSELSDF